MDQLGIWIVLGGGAVLVFLLVIYNRNNSEVQSKPDDLEVAKPNPKIHGTKELVDFVRSADYEKLKRWYTYHTENGYEFKDWVMDELRKRNIT